MANDDGGSSFALGFLVGAVVGILIAPRAGADMRADLGGRSEAWRSRAEEMAAVMRERMSPTVENVRERVRPTVDSVRERINPAVESMRERVGPVMEQVTSRMGGGQDILEADGTDGSTDGTTDVADGSGTPQNPEDRQA